MQHLLRQCTSAGWPTGTTGTEARPLSYSHAVRASYSCWLCYRWLSLFILASVAYVLFYACALKSCLRTNVWGRTTYPQIGTGFEFDVCRPICLRLISLFLSREDCSRLPLSGSCRGVVGGDCSSCVLCKIQQLCLSVPSGPYRCFHTLVGTNVLI